MADLATLEEFEAYLGGEVAAEADLRQSLLDMAEAAFESACGRAHAPFSDAQEGRVEYHDGTGTDRLWLDYGVADVTEILLGEDFAAPDETLDVSDRAVVVFQAGSARLARTDGGAFGCLGAPGYVRVTYDAAADLPADAKLAVLAGAAAVYQRRGSEGVKSESAGPYSVTYWEEDKVAMPPIWHAAVAAHTRHAP